MNGQTDSCPARVVIATPVLLLGGTEMHILALVEALTHGGYALTVCCYCEYDEAMVAEVEDLGAEVVLLRVSRDNGRLGISGVSRLARRFLAVMREVRPDIVHVEYLAPGLIPVILARLAGRRTVFATVHIAGREFYGWKSCILLRVASTFCSAFFCVSKGVESFWFGSAAILDPLRIDHRRRHFTIYNSVPSGRIEAIGRATDRRALRNKLGVKDSPVIGFVGRLSHQKGLSYLVSAFAAVVQAIPGAKLVVVGEGPERAVLERELQERGLRERAFLLGAQARDQVFSYLNIFDVLAVPSLYEGFGLMAAEAGAASVPVVASAVAGLSEVVEDEVTGLLVAPGDTKGLAAALIGLLRDPGRRSTMGEAAREFIRRKFSFDVFQAATLAAYRNFYVGAHVARRS